MQGLGRQVLVELYACDIDKLNDERYIRTLLLTGTKESGATVITDTFHQFSPHGVSGVIVIAESHVAIHTWPEYGYAAIDIFTCGDSIDPWCIFDRAKGGLGAKHASSMELKRGLFRRPVRYKPSDLAHDAT
jgi:S-adenosylmethionine decarboxylase proenzyme